MTFPVLTYPLDIIKTNRILQTSLSKEGAESIPREFLALYEKGALSRGLYRGLLVGYLAATLKGTAENLRSGFVGALAVTILSNPLSIMQVHKQAFHNNQTKSYNQIVKEVGFSRMFTLGLIPSLVRNFLLVTGFIPSFIGQYQTPITVLYALGGILLSHPFEVARTLIQYNGAKSGMCGDSIKVIRGLYATDGIAGLYRGVVPRTIHILPTIVTLTSLHKAFKTQ
jgi:Mitochondrial carrier protein